MTAKKSAAPSSGAEVFPASLDLSGILEAVRASAQPLRTADVDISRFVGKPEGAAVLTLSELDTACLFQATKDGEALRASEPHWTLEMCVSVTMLATAHRLPAASGPRLDLYAEMARTNRALFLHVLKSYNQAFPASASFVQSKDEAKNV